MQTTTKKPPSVEILFLRHSKARVISADAPVFTGGRDHNGAPVFTRSLEDVDVIARHAKYWSKH